jgi:hypothetical protein
MWRNFMQCVLSETKVKEHFTEQDFRAKYASDADTLERASAHGLRRMRPASFPTDWLRQSAAARGSMLRFTSATR